VEKPSKNSEHTAELVLFLEVLVDICVNVWGMNTF
jgi:hypothetical protein